MLAMNKAKRQPSTPRRSRMRMPRISIPNWIFGTIAVLFLLVGGYLLLLTTSPIIAPHFTKPITVATLAKPEAKDNRIIIPKIGVNIPYGTNGKLALDRGAWWRYPDHGNPEKGGNFVVAAHRFSIQPTPRGTVEKSPFFHIDKLALGDQILADYQGKRDNYKITKKFDVKPTSVEIEAPTEDARLTLYSCDLGGAKTGRVVIVAEKQGEVAS